MIKTVHACMQACVSSCVRVGACFYSVIEFEFRYLFVTSRVNYCLFVLVVVVALGLWLFLLSCVRVRVCVCVCVCVCVRGRASLILRCL